MNQIAKWITTHQGRILGVGIVLALLSAILIPRVSVNYDMVDYLPQDAPATLALDKMAETFTDTIPNANVMLKEVTIPEALEIKEQLALLEGVGSVLWLDDVIGLDILKQTPVDFLNPDLTERYYQDGYALIGLVLESGTEVLAVEGIQKILREGDALAGNGVNAAVTQELAVSEVLNALIILLPLILVILFLSTTSWIEPFLFLSTIGLAIVFNMGTNLIFGEVSYITQTVSPVLQLAVSLDYAIFLLYSFDLYRKDHEPKVAMQLAMKRALPTVFASAATTIIGFSALLFMRFGIGADLGINLVKGVILSFLSVMILLPALTLVCYKWIDKTKHKDFIHSIDHIGKGLIRIRMVFLVLAILVIVPSYLAQKDITFMYGMGDVAEGSTASADLEQIEAVFGKENPLVLLVPTESPGKEAVLADALSQVPGITQVMAYVTAVDPTIPVAYVPEAVQQQFYAKGYTRMILYTDNPEEGDQTFATVEAVHALAGAAYEDYHLGGQGAILYDMKNVVEVDTSVVNLVAMIGIYLILMVMFKSFSVPLLLVLTIKSAIWINLSFSYFSGQSLSFIGYLIVSTVQLGATVDYAILLTNHYLEDRKQLGKKDAIIKTLSENLEAILVSASVLALAGFILAATSTNPIIKELGTLLGRGTVLSFIMVVCVLPALLAIMDGVIQKTTWKHGFHRQLKPSKQRK